MSSVKVEYETYQSQNLSVNELSLKFSVADIQFKEYDGENITIEYPIFKNKKGETISSVRIEENEKLSLVEKIETKNWIFFMNTPSSVVKVNVPRNLNLAVNLVTDTGDIVLEESQNYTFSTISIQCDTGDIQVKSKISVQNVVRRSRPPGL